MCLENRTDFVESDQDNEEDTQDVDDPMQVDYSNRKLNEVLALDFIQLARRTLHHKKCPSESYIA